MKIFLKTVINKISVILLLSVAISHPSTAQTKTEPVIVVMHIDVMPSFTSEALPLLKDYRHNMLSTTGIVTCKLDVEAGRPNHFTIVEEWKDEATYNAHVGENSSIQFRNKIQSMLGGPIDERLHTEVK